MKIKGKQCSIIDTPTKLTIQTTDGKHSVTINHNGSKASRVGAKKSAINIMKNKLQRIKNG